MTDQDIPPLVQKLAAKVNMTPIAWRFDRVSVTIVFKQGPKLTFDLLPDNPPGKPVFVTKDDVTGQITKITDLASDIQTPEKPKVWTKPIASTNPPKRKPRK